MPALPLAADALLVVLRWLHALATIALLGTAAVYQWEPPSSEQQSARARRFKEVADGTMLVFLASGAVLSFDRLSRGPGGDYAILLALKIILAVGTYHVAFRWRRAGFAVASPDGRAMLVLGTATVLLASVLKGVFERGLRGDV